MVRVNIVLAVLLVLCSLALVTSQHNARKLFIDVERAQTQSAQHEVRWNQLQVEQTALANASLIDAKARRELAMQSISADRTLHLVIDPVERIVRLSSPLPELNKKAAGAVPQQRTKGQR
ncbi:MAG: cell division protein FtsL [Burkholderiales bacterium]|nr:cell division protein FtsL [Burkholderiales bacterium]